MKRVQIFIPLFIIALFVSSASAKARSPAHKKLPSDLQNAVNSSKHLQEVVNKGTSKMGPIWLERNRLRCQEQNWALWQPSPVV